MWVARPRRHRSAINALAELDGWGLSGGEECEAKAFQARMWQIDQCHVDTAQISRLHARTRARARAHLRTRTGHEQRFEWQHGFSA